MNQHSRKRDREEGLLGSEHERELSHCDGSLEVTRHCKKRRLGSLNVGNNAVENIGRRTYKHTLATSNARVQYGDQVYNIRNFYAGTLAETSTGDSARDAGVLLAVTWSRLRKQNPKSGWKNSLLRVLDYLLSRLPSLLFIRISTFEDAFGRSFKIDVDTISDWPEFEALLRCKFEKTRGLARVKDGKYRLQDGQDSQLINPRREAPEFCTLFAPGNHIFMSIYFHGSEVALGRCPRCSMEQEALNGTETVCNTCRFIYTAESEAPNEKEDIHLSFSDVAQDGLEGSQCSEDLDRPEHFNRISIGVMQQPQPTHDDFQDAEEATVETDGNDDKRRSLALLDDPPTPRMVGPPPQQPQDQQGNVPDLSRLTQQQLQQYQNAQARAQQLRMSRQQVQTPQQRAQLQQAQHQIQTLVQQYNGLRNIPPQVLGQLPVGVQNLVKQQIVRQQQLRQHQAMRDAQATQQKQQQNAIHRAETEHTEEHVGMPPPPGASHRQYPTFSPYEIDVKTERQIFVNDIPTRRDSTLSTFSTFEPSSTGALDPLSSR